jgi:WhiB family redox-sensing transcriptional regulator
MNARPDQPAARVTRLAARLGFDRPGSAGWHRDAACAGRDPELFYPVEEDPRQLARINRAKQVCAGCPVRGLCLADVMASEDPGLRWGVTGGLSPAERSALFAARRAGVNRKAA